MDPSDYPVTLRSLCEGIGIIVLTIAAAFVIGIPILKLGDVVFGQITKFKYWLVFRSLEQAEKKRR